MQLKCYFWTLLGFVFLPISYSANILFYMNVGSNSHMVVWSPLVFELARRGHNVTFFGPLDNGKLKAASDDPHINITYISLDDGKNFEDFLNSTELFEGKPWQIDFRRSLQMGLTAQSKSLANPELQKLLKWQNEETQPFDLAILTPITVDVGIYIAKVILRIPVIQFFVALKFPPVDIALGNPYNPSFVPIEYLNYGQKMSFRERVFNTAFRLIWPLSQTYWVQPQVGEQLREALALKETPDLMSLFDDCSFGLFNSHPLFDGVRPVNPNTAMVPGIHIERDHKKLEITEDEELINWMEETENGIIFVSFGSVLKASAMPKYVRDAFCSAFGHLHTMGYRVIWKWEEGYIKEKPKNILLRNWLPQQSILSHPKTKLFLTQGGLMSVQESLYHGVPLLVMPAFSDQFSNGARAERQGYGKQLFWNEFSEEKLSKTLIDVLTNQSVSQTAKRFGEIFRDEPQTSLDRAAYYVEYILRHQGADFLRSPAKDLHWYEFYCLDIACFLLVLTVSTFLILYKCFRLILKKITKNNAIKQKHN